MAKIGLDLVAAAYAVARRVLAGDLTEREGVDLLVHDWEMNRASASDYIRNLRQMLAGKAFHRTLNAEAIRFYLINISKDYGVAAGARALASVRRHVEYYNALGNGRLNLVASVCDQVEADLSTAGADNFQAEVAQSLKLSSSQRAQRLARASKQPSIYPVIVVAYKRNPDVVAEVLLRASGICEGCNRRAPFQKKSNSQPYLEVHHKIRLADNGEDSVENAIALCPNCHRERHYG